jgi:biopolymer transport protein ExbD
MKMRSAEKVHYDSGPNMTPLVDVVMVILIFLMLTGTFAAGEHFLVSTSSLKGKSANTAQKDQKLPDETNLEIRVDSFARPGPDGAPQDIWSASAGRVRVENNRDQLTLQLNKMREEFASAATPVDKIQVVINPGRQTKYKHLIEVYQAAMEAKFTKIGFSTAH